MRLLAQIGLVIFFGLNAFGFECQKVLKEMKLVELDVLPQVKEGRSIASADSKDEGARKKRIALMKKFLDSAPIDKQRAFAILLVNYFLDQIGGKQGNLLDAMDLVENSGGETKVVLIQPNDPNNDILRYLTKTTKDDLTDVKGLTVYLLRAKNVHVEPAKVMAFLLEQIQKGNSHFALLQKNCVAGDPTLKQVYVSGQ